MHRVSLSIHPKERSRFFVLPVSASVVFHSRCVHLPEWTKYQPTPPIEGKLFDMFSYTKAGKKTASTNSRGVTTLRRILIGCQSHLTKHTHWTRTWFEADHVNRRTQLRVVASLSLRVRTDTGFSETFARVPRFSPFSEASC